MKKSNWMYIFDLLYYGLVIALPFLLLLGVSINGGTTAIDSLVQHFTGYFAGTDVHTAIVDVIGPAGVAPLLNANSLWMADWIVLVVYASALHLIIDCFKFIPACAHNLLVRLSGDWFE